MHQNIVPPIGNQHFFVKYLFILENKVQHFQILIFQNFTKLKNKHAKYTLWIVYLL